jgi:hypothetical protein
VSLNVANIADQVEVTAETVTKMLQGFRDEIVETVLNKNVNASLTFGIGSLNLGKDGSI